MSKKSLIISIVVIAFISLGAAIGGYMQTAGKSAELIAKEKSEQTLIQEKIDTLEKDKDQNSHLPSDIVRFFVNDVKSGDTKRAKLYLLKENQNMDLSTVKFDLPLDEVIVKEVSYELSDEKAVVKVSYNDGQDETNWVKYFDVIKEENNWKIVKF